MPEKLFQGTAGEKFSPVVIEGQGVVRSSVVVQRKEVKTHAIDSHRRQSDADVRAAIREGHNEGTARNSEAQHSVVNAPTNVVCDEKGATSGVSESDRIAKDWSGLACESNRPAFRCVRSAQVTGDLVSVPEGVRVTENIPS